MHNYFLSIVSFFSEKAFPLYCFFLKVYQTDIDIKYLKTTLELYSKLK